MLHITCDMCGDCLQPGVDLHYVIKIEAYPEHDPSEITEADLDADHLDAISQMIHEMEDNPEEYQLAEPNQKFRYDLCSHCHSEFVRAPLGNAKAVKNLKFSKN